MTDKPFAQFAPAVRQPTPLRQAITAAYRRDEAEALEPLIAAATVPQLICAMSCTCRRVKGVPG